MGEVVKPVDEQRILVGFRNPYLPCRAYPSREVLRVDLQALARWLAAEGFECPEIALAVVRGQVRGLRRRREFP